MGQDTDRGLPVVWVSLETNLGCTLLEYQPAAG